MISTSLSDQRQRRIAEKQAKRLADEVARQTLLLNAALPEPVQPLTADEQKLELRFFADMQQVETISSLVAREEKKAELLHQYESWIDGVMAQPSPVQNEMFMRLLIWQLDAGNLERGIKMAEYALLNNWVLPEGYKRNVATLLVDRCADTALRADNKPEKFVTVLEQVIELTRGEDIVDQARAKLYKAYGLGLDEIRPTDAYAAMQMAARLDNTIGLSTKMKKLEKQLRLPALPAASAAPDGSQQSEDSSRMNKLADPATTVQPSSADLASADLAPNLAQVGGL